ncbi:MAG: branched-chain amino acid ABC transporter permease [Acidimicrobiia bacterium]|jgi:branched-chain amino acid transport system permease protein
MQQLINGLALGSTFALLGVGVTLVWGVLHILTFAHAQMMTAGAFATLWAVNRDYHVLVAIAVGVLFAAFLSGLMDVTLFTRLRVKNAPTFTFVIVTIGVAQIMEAVAAMRTNSQFLAFPRRDFPVQPLEIFGRNVPRLSIWMLVISVVVMIALGVWLQKTKSGTAVRAVAYSRETGELLGINSKLVFATCFVISGALAALGGIFMAASSGQLSYSSNDALLLMAFAVIVLGGMGSIRGAVVGGLLLGLVSVYATVYVSPIFREVVAMLTILAVLVMRPSGLFGAKESARV